MSINAIKSYTRSWKVTIITNHCLPVYSYWKLSGI